jgi:hypothetical protein
MEMEAHRSRGMNDMAPRMLHHRGRGVFMVAGETLKLPSKAK